MDPSPEAVSFLTRVSSVCGNFSLKAASLIVVFSVLNVNSCAARNRRTEIPAFDKQDIGLILQAACFAFH